MEGIKKIYRYEESRKEKTEPIKQRKTDNKGGKSRRRLVFFYYNMTKKEKKKSIRIIRDGFKEKALRKIK